jgi:hypothetical protein
VSEAILTALALSLAKMAVVGVIRCPSNEEWLEMKQKWMKELNKK